MTKTPQEIIIAALVAKLGGQANISMQEYEEAESLELYRMEGPTLTAAMSFKTVAPPVILEGELAEQPAITDS